MKDVIVKEQIFNHPINKVWDAISKQEEISTWFIKADFKAVKGYQYTFTASPAENCVPITGEVKEADPYVLSYTWIVQDTEAETLVTWKLEEVEGGTKLHLEHSGISGYKGDTAVQMFNSFNGGWDNCMNELSTYLRKEVHAK